MDKARRARSALLWMALFAAAALIYSGWSWTKAARLGWSGASFKSSTEWGKGERLSVNQVQPRSPAALAGLREGDRIASINGVQYGQSEVLRGLRAGDEVRMRVEREGKESGIQFRLGQPMREPLVLLGIVFHLIAGVAFLSIGGVVYWRQPGDRRAGLFFAVCLLFGLRLLVSAGPVYLYTLTMSTNALPLVLLVAGVTLFPSALLHFALIFPRRRPILERAPEVLRWIYGIPGALTLLVTGLILTQAIVDSRFAGDLTPLARGIRDALAPHELALLLTVFAHAAALLVLALARWWRWDSGVRLGILRNPGLTAATILAAAVCVATAGRLLETQFGMEGLGKQAAFAAGIIAALPAVIAFAVSFLAFPVAACLSLHRSYSAASPEERRQIRWPVWGLSVAALGAVLIGPIVQTLRWVLGFAPNSLADAAAFAAREHLPVLIQCLIPVSFAVAILRYRLMDIDLVIRRTAIYGVLMGLLGVMYVGLLASASLLVSQSTGLTNQWITVASTLAVVAISVPLRNRVQGFVDRRLLPARRNQAEGLSALTRTIADAAGPTQMFTGIAQAVQGALETRSVAVWARTGTDRLLQPVAQIGLPEGALAPMEAGSPEREPVPGEPMTFALAVARGETVGMIGAGPRLDGEALRESDREFLSAAANQLAIGLGKLGTYEQQQEMAQALEIQRGLLPAQIPQTPGVRIAATWQPARTIGGDYYDVISLPDGAVALVIADVSGKGLPAALLMSNVQAVIRALASGAASPEHLCERVNKILCGYVATGKFITLFYGVLRQSGRQFSYCNAGHNPPLVCRESGEVLRLESGGPILGVLPDAAYEGGSIELAAGDRLLLFTDGVSEAMTGSDEEFGEDRLIEVLRSGGRDAAHLQASVMEAVNRFCQGNFHDDATLIAVSIERTTAAWR